MNWIVVLAIILVTAIACNVVGYAIGIRIATKRYERIVEVLRSSITAAELATTD